MRRWVVKSAQRWLVIATDVARLWSWRSVGTNDTAAVAASEFGIGIGSSSKVVSTIADLKT